MYRYSILFWRCYVLTAAMTVIIFRKTANELLRRHDNDGGHCCCTTPGDQDVAFRRAKREYGRQWRTRPIYRNSSPQQQPSGVARGSDGFFLPKTFRRARANRIHAHTYGRGALCRACRENCRQITRKIHGAVTGTRSRRRFTEHRTRTLA